MSLPVCSFCFTLIIRDETFPLPAAHMLPCLPINTDSFWNCSSNSSFYNLPLVKVFYHSNRKVTKYLISIVIYQEHVKIPWVKRVTNGNIYKVSVYRYSNSSTAYMYDQSGLVACLYSHVLSPPCVENLITLL